MPYTQTAMRHAAIRQANERAEREATICTAYVERCDGDTIWYVRSEAEGVPEPRKRGVVSTEYVARPGNI